MCTAHALGNDHAIIVFFIIAKICYCIWKHQRYIAVLFSNFLLVVLDDRCDIFVKLTVTSDKKSYIRFGLY